MTQCICLCVTNLLFLPIIIFFKTNLKSDGHYLRKCFTQYLISDKKRYSDINKFNDFSI